MQLLTTAEQMQRLDRSAIGTYAIPGIVLMENAGRAFVDLLEKYVGSPARNHVVVVCGKGNNGGDGFVIARHLSNRGADVRVLLLGKKREVKGDAQTNLSILLKMVGSKRSTIVFHEVPTVRKLHTVTASLSHPPAVVVDALFGTGFVGAVRSPYREAIEWMNSLRTFRAAVDIPSGVNASTGVVDNVAVRADLTVTIGLAKIGHYVGDGKDHAGIVEIADISIPRFLFQIERQPTYRVHAEDVRHVLPRRPHTAHKYSVGKVFVIAGSRTLTGAPFMTAVAALRAGAGAVILGVPKSLHPSLIRKVTEVMITPLEETDEGTISPEALETIQERLRWADVVALGPGLSQNLETRKLVHTLVPSIVQPLVLDADGLGMMAYDISLLKKRRFSTIITPHVGELRSLTKLDRGAIERERVEVARSQAHALNTIVVLKGSPTIVGTPDGHAFMNSTGNPGMATAGAGDVLTGIIASFAAQGMTPKEAAWAGVFVHGLAGDIAAEKFGQRSLMAMDILEAVPEALRSIEARP